MDDDLCDLCMSEVAEAVCPMCGNNICQSCEGGIDPKNRTWCSVCWDDPSTNAEEG